jgi:hypothetical protein
MLQAPLRQGTDLKSVPFQAVAYSLSENNLYGWYLNSNLPDVCFIEGVNKIVHVIFTYFLTQSLEPL